MDAPTDEYPDCVYGDVDADMTVAIVGHSHADTYVEPLHMLGLERGFRVVTMLREACPLTLRTSWFVKRDCVTWSRGAVDRPVDENGKPFYPNRCMRKQDDWANCAVPRSRMYEPENPADRFLSQWPTAWSAATADWFCPFEWCSPVIGNIVVYRDRDHMTNAYARSLAPLLGEQVDAALAHAGAAAR